MRLFTPYRIAVGIAIVALALVIGLNGFGTFYTDIKPEIYFRPWDVLGQYLSSWTSSPYLGSPNFNVGLAPVLLMLSGMRGIGLSPEWTFKIFHFVLWLVAAFGAVRLTRVIAPQVGKWGGLLAGVLFLANPYTVSAGATLAIALPMAFLPWQLLCLVHGLRRPNSWAWPALFALSFFAMSGMNVAVVPLFQLLAVIPLIWAIRVSEGLRFADAAKVLLRSAILVVLVSLYWLVPAFSAMATGAQIVEGSETLDGIAKVSSLTEVLRGLGLWPLYGSSSIGPWVPEHAVYVVSPLVMLFTALWPTLGLAGLSWARTRARAFVVAAVFGASVVMVGVFASQDSPASPFGMLLRELLSVPALSAFRTTNKIGAVLVIAMTIGIAIFVVSVGPKIWERVPLRMSAAVLAIATVAAWSVPAFAGRLYISPIEIPDYWTEAASFVDDSSQPGSVLILPGQVRPFYRWTEERPDDIINSLIDRRSVLPETTPNASAPGVNFLAALDGSIQSGTSSDKVASTMSRYLGSGQVLLRHDLVWENSGGARPAEMNQQIGSDPGLFGQRNFGEPGQNTLSPAMEDPAFFGEQNLPPVQVYDVNGARDYFRATPVNGGIVVAGDGWAFPAMADADLVGSSPLVHYAQDLSKSEFLATLPLTSRLVITDTNARRSVISNRLTVGQGPLLSADQELGATRTLGTDPEDQTVRVDSGVSVTTTRSGGTFFDLPYGTGDFAIDGDLSTGWRFGDFGTAKGQKLVAKLDKPITLTKIPIAQLPIGDVQIDQVTVSAGGKSDTITLPESGLAVADLGEVEADTVTVTVNSTRGEGFNFVGIAEIGLDGNYAHVAGRTPLTFSNLHDKLDDAGQKQFARTPLDVLLTRVQNTASTGDDSERQLNRIVTLPDDREFEVSANVRVNGSVEVMYDRVAGYGKDIRVESSGFYFDNPGNRASMAADQDPDTAWVPGNGTRNATWTITSAPREISSVRVVQKKLKAEPGTASHQATRVAIEVDGKEVTQADIGMGETKIDLPEPVTGSSVKLTITGLTGDPNSTPPSFTTIDTGLQLPDNDPKEVCLPVALFDGQGFAMRPADSTLARVDQQGTKWVGCKKTELSTGEHVIDQNPAFVIDSMSLKDSRTPVVGTYEAAPATKVTKRGDTELAMTVSGTTGPYAVTIGQSYNANWRATADGKDLGPAQVIDGFSSGWIVWDGSPAKIEIRYAPQRWSNIALGVSALAVIAALLTALVAVRRRTLFSPVSTEDLPTGWYPTKAPQGVLEFAFVAGSGLFLGIGGLLGALGVVAINRFRPISPQRIIYLGSALVFASVVALILVTVREDKIGEVSADIIAASLVPHHLAAAGLVGVLGGVLLLLKRRTDDD
ncbi:MAG TPA: alpha-(1-_3)-arabinofuranosyltransferase family protein [Aeromicrobium sp.]|nr:alpha-(1->3)-arabinofuranosyltransferase family protein [Aeromicrobium sp.]